MIKRWAFVWIVVAVLLLALAAYLFRIADQSIWFDEGWSAHAAAQPTLLDAARADLTNPPLYYMVLHVGARLFGLSEFALRWVSTIFGLLTIALVYRLAADLFGRRAGMFAALLAACLPLLWWAAQEARMYTLLAFLVMICALAWHRLLRVPTRWAWIALWLAELGLLYAHNTGPIVALWLNAVTLIAWIVRRSLRRPDWRWWLTGQAVVAAIYAPWFATYYLRLGEANSAVTSAPGLTPALLAQIWQAFFAGPWSLVGQSTILIALSMVAFALFASLIPWRRPAARWLVLHTLLLTGGVIAGLVVLGNEMHGRYLVMVAPLLVIPLAAGIARLRPNGLRWLAVAPFVVTLIVVLVLAQNPAYQHDDARAMVRYYAESLTADDTVIAWSYADRYELAYYWDRLGVTARRVTLPEGAPADEVLPLLPAEGRIARNIWYTQRADYRGMIDCILGDTTVDAPLSFTVAGMTDELNDQPGRSLPPVTAVDFAFGSVGESLATLVGYGEIAPGSPDQARCVPLELMLDRTTATPLKAALIVRNALGWEIARADAVFAQADQQTSDQRLSGDHLTAYPLLRLPYGTPPGEYQVLLRVYEETLPSGYEPLVAPDVPTSGRDLVLATWIADDAPVWAASNRTTDLPFQPDLALDAATRLLAHDLAPEQPTRRNGDVISMTLLWQTDAPPPDLTLRDVDGRWSLPIATTLTEADGIVLDWRLARIPADAPSGVAEIVLPDGTELARQPIEAVEALYEPPAFDHALSVAVPGVGDLAGYSLDATELTLETPPQVTLVWRAGDGEPAGDYVVFVQLLDADGRLIAQSDARPAQAMRPTVGWRAGEYIVDPHQLTYNEAAHPGSAHLIVGLYDPATNQRLLLADGADAASLPIEIIIR
ncbi:MAG: glycosyltransferase family 39 protein [Anaerolineae bacterium]|nr:glycosyltransferase family 39 protein [Anaerolineae bacterium]